MTAERPRQALVGLTGSRVPDAVRHVVTRRRAGTQKATQRHVGGWAPALQRTAEKALRSVRGTRPAYVPFGRTMAQPMRRSCWRPVTSHSKARGTSGTMPGKRARMSGGGVPAVSEARQTTTPPVSLNLV